MKALSKLICACVNYSGSSPIYSQENIIVLWREWHWGIMTYYGWFHFCFILSELNSGELL